MGITLNIRYEGRGSRLSLFRHVSLEKKLNCLSLPSCMKLFSSSNLSEFVSGYFSMA